DTVGVPELSGTHVVSRTEWAPLVYSGDSKQSCRGSSVLDEFQCGTDAQDRRIDCSVVRYRVSGGGAGDGRVGADGFRPGHHRTVRPSNPDPDRRLSYQDSRRPLGDGTGLVL